ncbi:transport protein particle complex II subunit [Maudiozyma humilis]|uniref:Transport protein particle complex II subunit n=1 Tax=Maudiozyma humilis TaxID=51915 RepID=A0AAV5S207_MAUHU|nr:transport protein particle complex II subunit [Kazachstania humilis]
MSLSNEKAVSITYFDPFALFESVKNEFEQILPLENIHWRSPNGVMRTISRFPITLKPENSNDYNPTNTNIPFIRCIIVSCNSVEEYRSKVRPLIREWIPQAGKTQTESSSSLNLDVEFTTVPIIFVYSNATVVDSNIFKSVSLMDKFNKDFPEVNILELKSVYKSLKEKEEFWNQLSQKIKSQVVQIFQARLDIIKGKLDKISELHGESKQQAETALLIKERLFDLYFKANLLEEGRDQLKEIKIDISALTDSTTPNGDLEIPFSFNIKEDDSIAQELQRKVINKFYISKYFFLREFFLLRLEMNNNPRILKLYKLVRQFLCQIECDFQNDQQLLSFQYIFLTNVIAYLDETKIKDRTILSEVKAELLLLKRDCWLHGVLSVTDYELIGKTESFRNDPVKYVFDNEPETFKTVDDFYDTFINYNTELLSLYNECGGKRQRITDIISLEVGMIHYQRKNYQSAVSLLISCYEYYVESNWGIIGLNILKVFADSLENCPKLEHIELDGSSVSVDSILRNSYLNLIKLTTSEDEKQKYWNKLLALKPDNAEDISYKIDGLFDISPSNSVYLSKTNGYAISVDIDNFGFPCDIPVDSMKLTLRESNHQEAKIVFSGNDLLVVKGSQSHELSTNDIKYGQFELSLLEITIHGTVFIREYGVDVDDFPEEHPADSSDHHPLQFDIFEIYSVDNVSITIEQAKSLKLGENALEVTITNQDNIKSSQLTLHVQNGPTYKYISFEQEDENVHSYTVSDVISCSRYIPYFLKEQITAFSMDVEFSFERNDMPGAFSERKTIPIECYLPVSVSVEDIFKKDMFFFKFLLSSSLPEEPTILHSSRLELDSAERSDNYSISGHFQPETPMLLKSSAEESCLNCYKLSTEGTFATSDVFNLRVQYNTLKEQIDCLVTDAILVAGDVEWFNKYDQWKLFWRANILPKLQYDNGAFSRGRRICLLNGPASVREMQSVITNRIVSETAVQSKMLACLASLARGVNISELAVSEYTRNLVMRELVVPVTMPELDQLFRVTFNSESESDNEGTTAIHSVGVPLQFRIDIENQSSKWGMNKTDSDNHSNDYIFEIQSSNDWLLQGRKRFVIPAPQHSFSVTLIPLKTGHLTLPHVEITNIDGEVSQVDQGSLFTTILVT